MVFKILGLWLGVFCFFEVMFYLYLGEEFKYKDNFMYFEYVNFNVKKGGVLRNDVIGIFDSFNFFAFKGIKVEGLDLIYDILMV